MEQQDLNKRLLIALVLSFLVFIGYGALFPAVMPDKVEQQKSKNTEKQAPGIGLNKVNNTSKQAPSVQNTKVITSPAPKQNTSKYLASIHAKNFKIDIDAYGRITQMELLEAKYYDDDGQNLKILDSGKIKPLEIRFSDSALNEEAFKTPYTNKGKKVLNLDGDEKTLVLTQVLSSLTLTKKITFKPSGEYKVSISTSSPVEYFVTPGHRPMSDTSMYMLVRGVLVKDSDNILTSIEDGDAEGGEVFKNAKIASSFDRYVASMFFDFDKGMNVFIQKEENGDPLIFVRGENTLELHAYIGPKDHEILKNINPELTDAIEFGFFSFLAIPFYKILLWINNYVGNWGWAIILFTLLVKLVLFPLSYKGMMSMQKLKDLAPKMKEIKEKYKGDSAKMNAQMMEMYKKHGANPMGGCLPLLLQIPVFFALYRVLLNAVELQGAQWVLWIEDLSRMDPYFVLPVLMGFSMWFQQRITPSNFTDPLQEKIFKWFPVIMTIFFVYFPSGLVLYWLINNLFTIAQQYFINFMYAKQKEAAIVAHKK